MNIYSNITGVVKRRKRIGFFIDALDQNFQSQVLEGISQICIEKNLDLMIFSGALKFAHIERYTKYEIVKDFIFQDEIDGLIILTGAITEHYSIPELKKIINVLQPLPMVSIGMEIPGISSVIMDNSAGIKKLLHHFIRDHGYKKIAFLKGPEDHEEARIRFQTYKETLKQENILFNHELVIEGSYFSENAGEEAISVLLDRNNVKVDAIVAADDSIAFGALRALKKRNIEVPENIALAGFDNQDKAETVLPFLTTVSQPFSLQGRTAVEILVKEIENKQKSGNTILSATMVVRNSCGCNISNNFPENNNCLNKPNKKTVSLLIAMLLETIYEGPDGLFSNYLEEQLSIDYSNFKPLIGWSEILSAVFNHIHQDKEIIPTYLLEKIYIKSNEQLLKFLQRDNKRKTLQEGEDRFKLNLFSHRLLTTFKQTHLFHIIYEQIISLRIKNCFIVLYKTEKDPCLLSSQWVMPQEVTLVLGIKDGIPLLEERQSITFKPDALLPDLWLNSDKRESFVFIPISIRDEQYGYALFDYNPDIFIDLYETLITIIGNAIHGCQLMEKLEKAVIQKTNLFVNITHEMKTPLTIMSSYLEKYLDAPDNLKDLFVVRRNVNKLKNDMVNFLDNEKMDRGLIFYSHSEIVDFSQFLLDKAQDFEELAKKDNIKISITCPNELYIKIDPAGLERIFNNLFDNAIRYNKPHGEIIITVKPEKDHIYLTFSNTGLKIDKKHSQAIFDPFHQISCQKRNIQGVGIGLSIVRKIIQSAGGAICLFPDISKTIFKITLPLTTFPNSNNTVSTIKKGFIPEDIKTPKLIKVEFDSKKDTILIVDDNVPMLSFLVESLSPLYNIFWAEDGEEGIDLLLKIPKPDIILSDIMMDKMDGFQFISHLKQNNRYKSIPILFLTAKDSQTARLKGLELGAADYILKPFIIEELKIKLKSLMEYKMMLQNSSRKEFELDLYKYLSTNKNFIQNIPNAFNTNEYNLSSKEQEIIKHLKSGKLYKEIAQILNLSLHTIKAHVYRIYRKCDINNKIQLFNINF